MDESALSQSTGVIRLAAKFVLSGAGTGSLS
jgi:hypothetical protein